MESFCAKSFKGETYRMKHFLVKKNHDVTAEKSRREMQMKANTHVSITSGSEKALYDFEQDEMNILHVKLTLLSSTHYHFRFLFWG